MYMYMYMYVHSSRWKFEILMNLLRSLVCTSQSFFFVAYRNCNMHAFVILYHSSVTSLFTQSTKSLAMSCTCKSVQVGLQLILNLCHNCGLKFGTWYSTVYTSNRKALQSYVVLNKYSYNLPYQMLIDQLHRQVVVGSINQKPPEIESRLVNDFHLIDRKL